MVEHEDGCDASDQSDAAAHGEIDMAGQDHQQHAEGEGGGDGELDGQRGEVAGGQILG